jgi:hypothetical protein
MPMIDFETVIPKFDAILARGLCSGVGERDGQMCIEAAICAALDLPHGDDPNCVSAAVRSYKIRLNDANWSSPEARAKGLRDLGIAQIGSKGVVDDQAFATKLAEKTIRVLIPALFREVFADNPECLAAANRCESEGTRPSAAAAAARAAAALVRAHITDGLALAAAMAAEAARAAAAAARETDGVGLAPRAAGDKYLILSAGLALGVGLAAAAAEAARAAVLARETDGVGLAPRAAGDKYLILSAGLALDVLRELNSPGCEWV